MKPTSRAEFLRLASLTAAATLVAPRLFAGREKAAAPGPHRAPQTAAGFSAGDLRSAAALDPVFWVHEPGGRRTRLQFEQAVEHPSGEHTVQFTMSFAGPAGARLAEATHAVSHSRLGTLELYLAPTHANAGDPAGYRAEFNLLQTAR